MDELSLPPLEVKRRYHRWSVFDDLFLLKHHGEMTMVELADELNRHYIRDERQKVSPGTVAQRHHKLDLLGLADLRCAGCGKAELNGGAGLWCPVRECPVLEDSPACHTGRLYELLALRRDV